MTGILTIAPAELAGAHLLIELAGGPSSGKTLTALRLARGIAGPQGKIGFLDTEAARGRFYAKHIAGGFHHGDLTPPFTPQRYLQAITEFVAFGVDVLVIDSLSHLWSGVGGVLDQADQAEASGKKGLLKWRTPKMGYNRFVNFLLSVRVHIIMCSRARQPVIQEGDKLLTLPWEPIHDKRLKYEMTIFVPMLLNGSYETDPARLKCPGDLRDLFGGELLTEAVGSAIGDWVAGGDPVNPAHELLRGRAYDTAALGSASLTAFWKGLSAADRAVVAPIGANLRSAAQAADDLAEQQREASDELKAGADKDELADPFSNKSDTDTRPNDLARAFNEWKPTAPTEPAGPAQTTAAFHLDPPDAAGAPDPFGRSDIREEVVPNPNLALDNASAPVKAGADPSDPAESAATPARKEKPHRPEPQTPAGSPQEPTDAEIERSQARIAAVLGHEAVAKMENDAAIFREIEPQKVKGGFDWKGYAEAVFIGYCKVPPTHRQTFRAAQSRYLGLLRSAARDASTELSMQMSEVDRAN